MTWRLVIEWYEKGREPTIYVVDSEVHKNLIKAHCKGVGLVAVEEELNDNKAKP
jgi:hypothetical protein